MPSAWVKRRRGKTGVRFRVEYRVGGRESRVRYAGSFRTKRDALTRKAWVTGELAAMRVPDLSALAEPKARPLLRVEDYRELLEQSTYRDDRVRPA